MKHVPCQISVSAAPAIAPFGVVRDQGDGYTSHPGLEVCPLEVLDTTRVALGTAQVMVRSRTRSGYWATVAAQVGQDCLDSAVFLGVVVDAELGEYCAGVGLDGADAEVEACRDAGVGQSFCREGECLGSRGR